MSRVDELSGPELAGKRIVIAGGSGFLGTSLAKYLTASGARLTILSRRKPTALGNVEHMLWDGRTIGNWTTCIDGADALINLAGRTVNCIKTPERRDEILRSRVESTRVLGAAVRLVLVPPPCWIQMSTAHIYGDPPSIVCDEDSVEGNGFAPDVGRAWEAAFLASLLPEQRGVLLRTSFVIGRDQGAGGGALATLDWLVRIGLGGRVGKGTQGMSWIHETDLNRLFAHALADATMSGVYVASAPNPVSQYEFMRTLRCLRAMPIGLPATEWMVRVGAALLLRTDPELALYGRYVVSKRLAAAGYTFEFPDLETALVDLYA